jgi:hypothetical protein
MLIGFESTCVIIIDAMGMASFKVPRHLPGSKEMGDLARPQLHVVGVIAHGFNKGGYLFDPTLAKDCNVFIEIILCTIARINNHCRDKRLSFPSRCLIVADTAGDNKSTWTFTMSAMFAASSLCRVAAHLSLRTGHSHEDIDAMFGDWSNVLVKQPTLETREDFRNVLSKKFPETIFTILTAVRDWKDYFNTGLVKFEGMGNSVGAAHSFVFVKRKDYDVGKHGEPTIAFTTHPPSPHDVILLVRQYMQSQELSQEPLVVIPAASAKNIMHQSMPNILPRMEYSVAQSKSLESRAKKLEQFPYKLTRAADYLKSLARNEVTDVCESLVHKFVFPQPDGMLAHAVAWQPPHNLIEPPEVVKLIVAKAVRDTAIFNRKRKKGIGKMNPSNASAVSAFESGAIVLGVDPDAIDEHGNFN